jgi:hypothetical protein|tara:strand:+ start:34 stop:243 length:210 start_codon:yes stop_codon:yes gene_type:complete
VDDLSRKNELELVEIKGELKLLSQKIDVVKTNDLYHLQKSLDTMSRRLWGIGFLIIGQLVVGLRMMVWG